MRSREPSAVPAPPNTWPRLPPNVPIGWQCGRGRTGRARRRAIRRRADRWTVMKTLRRSRTGDRGRPLTGELVSYNMNPVGRASGDAVTGARDRPRHETVDRDASAREGGCLHVEPGEPVVGAVPSGRVSPCRCRRRWLRSWERSRRAEHRRRTSMFSGPRPNRGRTRASSSEAGVARGVGPKSVSPLLQTGTYEALAVATIPRDATSITPACDASAVHDVAALHQEPITGVVECDRRPRRGRQRW